MGNYIAYADVLERTPGADDAAKLVTLGKLLGESGESAVTAAVNTAISLAEGKVDGYAAVRYAVPLPANEMTANWALTIVEYEIYKRTAFAEVQAKYVKAYDDTIKELKDVGKGTLTISGGTEPTATARGTGPMVVLSDDPQLDETNFVGY